MKLKWESWIGWVAWICVLGLLVKINGQYLEQSERIKAFDKENAKLREELRAENQRYRDLQKKIQSYRQIPKQRLGRQAPKQGSGEEETEPIASIPAESDQVRDFGEQSHWLLDVEDDNTLAVVGEIAGFAELLSKTEWQVVAASKELMLDEVLNRLSEEERQALEELRKEGYFETWLNELIELTVLDSMRVNESIEQETADLAGSVGTK